MEKKKVISTEAQLELGTLLRQWRLRNNYTQPQVGKMFGVSRYSILRCERDGAEISTDTAYKIHAGLAKQLRLEGVRLQKIDEKVKNEPVEVPEDLLSKKYTDNWML